MLSIILTSEHEIVIDMSNSSLRSSSNPRCSFQACGPLLLQTIYLALILQASELEPNSAQWLPKDVHRVSTGPRTKLRKWLKPASQPAIQPTRQRARPPSSLPAGQPAHATSQPTCQPAIKANQLSHPASKPAQPAKGCDWECVKTSQKHMGNPIIFH